MLGRMNLPFVCAVWLFCGKVIVANESSLTPIRTTLAQYDTFEKMVNLLKNEATSTSLISISLIKMSCVTLMLTENCLHWVVISYNFPNPKQSVQTLVKEHIYIAISRIFGVSDRSYVLPKEFKITHNVTFALEIESTISISTTLIFQIDNGNKHIADTLKSNYIELKKYYYFTLKNTRLVQPSESQRQSFRRLLDSWILNYKQQSLKHHDDYVFIESSISGTSSVVVQVFYEQLAHQEKAKLALINAACWIVDNICLISHQVNEGASIDECKKLFFANAAIKTDCYNYNYGNQCVLKNVWKLALAIEPKYLPKRFEKV